MKKLLVCIVSILVSVSMGCVSYHPEKYIKGNSHRFWTDRENKSCPVCNADTKYLRSYYGTGLRYTYDSPLIHYYICSEKHLFVFIEEVDKETRIEVVK